MPNAQIDNVRITITYTSPLSADLAYLYTQCSEGKVTTSWAVVAQQNNDYFTLERSDDQHTFTEVGRINGAGTSQAFATYEWTDDIRATTTTCYRLSQTDYDGKTSILGTSRGDCRTQEQLTLHPNPVDGHYFVASYPYEKHRRYELVVYDPKGITVHRSSDTAVTAITVNTSEWERGIYFVQLTEDGQPVAPERLVVH